MIVVATNHRWQKAIDVSLIAPILVLSLILTGQCARAEYTIRLSKVAESLDGHSTTRTTVRRVFHHDGYWYVFCGDIRDRVYCNFFVTSTDGFNWSERKIGSGGGVVGDKYGAPNLPETAIVYGDKVYGCYSEKEELCIRSGTLDRGHINWSAGHRIAPGPGSGTTRDFYFYYPDIMLEGDGLLSISLRHCYKSGTTQRMDPAFVISSNPDDITRWRAPRDLIALGPAEGVDAHENVPLRGGRRVVIVRSCCGVTDKELYKPGCPGKFYAVHYDGARWLTPVDLGDSDGIAGSDKRLSAMLDPGTGSVHLAYVEDSSSHFKNELRYRTLSAPYGVDDWSPPTTIATNVFTVMLGMDTSSVPARIAAVYGDQKHEGGGLENFRNTPKELMFALVKPDDQGL